MTSLANRVSANVHLSADLIFHSIDMALGKIQNGIVNSLVSGKTVALTLLDWPATFDMINRSIQSEKTDLVLVLLYCG